jgi:beta-galactosidase/beta-glucuronidase
VGVGRQSIQPRRDRAAAQACTKPAPRHGCDLPAVGERSERGGADLRCRVGAGTAWTLLASLALGALPVAPACRFGISSPLAEPRVQICLNGDWVRHDGGDANRVPDGGWQTVRVPEYPRNAASGSAWFRLDFRIPEELGGGGRRLVLRFVRVRHYAKLLLNGVMCGENWGQRAPFEVDVTTAGRPGQLNRLEVWVHSCSAEYAMPGKVVDDPRTRHRLSTLIGYRDQATIAEDVFLVSRPDLYVSRAVTTPSVRKKTLTVRLTIANQSVHAREVVIANRVFLSSAEVLKMPDKKLEVAAGESRTVTVSAPWAEARWWGYPPYGEPVLYHLETRVLGRRGRPVDRLIKRFCFREVWTEGDRIVLNG